MVLRPRSHDKRLRGTVGSCVRALARKSYRSLTTRLTAHPARDSTQGVPTRRRFCWPTFSTFISAESRSWGIESLLDSRNGQCDLAPSHESESVALSAPTLVRGIQAQVQVHVRASGGNSRHNSHVSVSGSITSTWTCPCTLAQLDSGHW